MQGFRFGLLASCVLVMGMPVAHAKFLQTDPVGYQDQMNLYTYCANDPLNCTDPTGMYGRGSGFTDREWRQFDRAQQSAASKINAESAKLSAAAAEITGGGALSRSTQNTIRSFERVMGASSATAENLNAVSGRLAENASALMDDGSNGFVANMIDTATMDARFPGSAPHNGVAAGVPSGTKILNLNRDHPNAMAGYVLAHEPNHNFGRPDQQWTGNGRTAYKRGDRGNRNAYGNLPSVLRLVNPDHLADLSH